MIPDAMTLLAFTIVPFTMNNVEFEVTGRKALFTFPEFKTGGESIYAKNDFAAASRECGVSRIRAKGREWKRIGFCGKGKGQAGDSCAGQRLRYG